MTYNVDALKLFMPYIRDTFGLPISTSITNLFFSVRGDDSKLGVRYIYSNTDYFKSIEAALLAKGFELIDDTFESIIIVIDKDTVLKESTALYLDGEFSKIHKLIYKSYISTLESIAQVKTNSIILVGIKDKGLRKKIEENLGVCLPPDCELGSLPDPSLFKFDYNN